MKKGRTAIAAKGAKRKENLQTRRPVLKERKIGLEPMRHKRFGSCLRETVSTKEWYVVNTYAGQENRVKENLERRVKTMGLEDSLFQIVVAEEKEIEYKNGKPVEKTHNLFSGYLLVQMIMTDEAWYVVRNTPGVTGFIGSSGKGAKPFPVAQEEVDAVLRRLGRQDVNVQVDFEVGDRVEITNGAFKNSEGVIEAMDEEKKEATVLLILFGRETPTEIPYMDLKKVD